jgi:phosphatidylserine decarboxylase
VDTIEYIDRKSGKKQTENVPGGGSLKFLYGKPLGKLTLSILVKRKFFSRLGGRLMNSKMSAKRIDKFVKEHTIDMDQFIEPDDGYPHFNSFFYRKLQEGSRPIGNGICSPADGKILVFPSLKEVDDFFIKGQAFNLETFLNNKNLSEKYSSGSMAIIRLAPPDYHRFHFPADGIVGCPTKINGAYYSVSPLALRKSLRIFLENKREHVELKTKEYGDMLIVDVGATLTGSILQTYKQESTIKKGDEKGYFAFGGSTTVLLFEKNKVRFDPDLNINSSNGFETTIQMGEQIAE